MPGDPPAAFPLGRGLPLWPGGERLLPGSRSGQRVTGAGGRLWPSSRRGVGWAGGAEGSPSCLAALSPSLGADGHFGAGFAKGPRSPLRARALSPPEHVGAKSSRGEPLGQEPPDPQGGRNKSRACSPCRWSLFAPGSPSVRSESLPPNPHLAKSLRGEEPGQTRSPSPAPCPPGDTRSVVSDAPKTLPPSLLLSGQSWGRAG